jgi:peptidoglycan hydrolase CwlO-like protein
MSVPVSPNHPDDAQASLPPNSPNEPPKPTALERVPYPDEEVDSDLDNLEKQLDLSTFRESDHHEIGALAFHVNAQLSDLETEPTTVYKKATEEIEAVRSAKVNFLKKRIDENSTKLTAFRARLEKVEAKIATVEPVLDQARSAQSNGWAKAVRERLAVIAELARKKQQGSEKPKGSDLAVAPESEVIQRRPLYPLNENLIEVPASQNEARIAYLWNRILQYRKDHEDARLLTTGLERNGITYLGARFLVWCGFSILIGAGGSIGALLESNIGSNMLERFLGAVQLRLGFIVPNPAHTEWSMVTNRELLPGIGIGLLITLGFVAIILLLLFITGLVKRRLDISGEEDEDASTSARSGQTADATPLTAGFLPIILDGQRAIMKWLPGFAIFAIGLLLFLAIGPNFYAQGSTITVALTRTSVGVVFALAIAAIAQVLFVFSVFPILRERLVAGKSLGLISPRAAITTVLMFVVVSSCAFAFGPVFSTVRTVTAASMLVTPLPATASVPQAPADIVWFIASTGLLLSCCILSLGNVFRGIYLHGKWVETKLFRLEVKLADKIRDLAPAPSAPTAPSEPVETDALATEIGHKWRSDIDSDVVLKRILLSGMFSAQELALLFDSHTELVRLEENCRQIESQLKRLQAEKFQIEKDIWSRERSTNNYESRITRLEQQAAGLRVQMDCRYQHVLRLLREGYRTAKAAYVEPVSEAMGEAA